MKKCKKPILQEIYHFIVCRKEINVFVDLNYDNGANHLDYRFQNFQNFILIYTILTVVYILCFLIFCFGLPKNKFPINTNNYFLISLLLTFFIQDIDALLLMNTEKIMNMFNIIMGISMLYI